MPEGTTRKRPKKTVFELRGLRNQSAHFCGEDFNIRENEKLTLKGEFAEEQANKLITCGACGLVQKKEV